MGLHRHPQNSGVHTCIIYVLADLGVAVPDQSIMAYRALHLAKR